MRLLTLLGAIAATLAVAPPTPCQISEAVSIKARFVESKYLYHTGKPCSKDYALNVVQAFDQVENPHERSVLMAMACVESGYNIKCVTVNRKGRSVGMMQIHNGIFQYFFLPEMPCEKILTDSVDGALVSVDVAREHFKNVKHSVGAYYLGPRGAKLRPKMAQHYKAKVWRVLKQMPWTRKNKQGEPSSHYWKYFER